MGLFSAINNQLGQLNNDLYNQVEEIKKDKILTMDEVFNKLKEKINKYNELSRNTENLGFNNSEVAKIEEEIRSLKAKIDELNSSIEGKSKIEKMKMTLNITSIESEITLKEMDLEEEKKKAEKDYDSRIQSSNKKIEDTKKELEIFIKDTEETLEKTVKNFSKKEEINNFKLTTLQEQGLNKLGLSVSDLSGIKLTNTELWLLEKLSNYSDEGVKNFNIVGLNNISMGINIRKSDDLKLYLKKFINIKNNKIAQKRKVAVRHNAKRKTVASAKRRKATKKTIAPTQYAENTAKAEDIQDDLEDEELLEEEEEDESIDIALTALSESKADTQQQKILLDTAFSYLGTPYRHGGITRKGMDCSGFVSTAFKSIEIPLSRSSQEMATQGKKIKLSNVQVGDLLFFKTLRKNRISHVGLVVDVDGGEVKFIHASSKRGVVISSLSDAYYKKAFRIAKRVM